MPLGGWAVIDGFCSALTSLRASTLSSWWSCSTTFTALAKQGQVQFNAIRLYGLGGFHGVSKASSLHEEVTRYLNGYVSALVPEHAWVALYVSRDTKVPVHRDLRNAPQFATAVKALGKFVGGGLWIEGDHGLGPVCKQLPDGTWRAGWVHDVRKEAVLFRGQKWHVSEH